MSQISTCPRCRLQISLPEKTSPAAQVKCPLCAAEYTLREALDQVPPMLIVLDPGPVESCVMSEAAVGATGATLDACSTGMLPQVEFPDAPEGDEPGGLPHYADDDDVEARVSLGDEAPDEGGAMIGGVLRERMRSDEGNEEDDFDLDRRHDGASRPGVLKAPRRAPRSSGGIGEVLKAVIGAIVGLSIGYYILLWLGRDPLQLKSFLSDYLPGWLLP
jgi:hypothetical protein